MDSKGTERMQSSVVKTQMISTSIRVIMHREMTQRDRRTRFRISAQQYAPQWPLEWEVSADGWRDTQTQYSPTAEGARRIFDEMVRNEIRYAEMKRARGRNSTTASPQA